MDQSAILEEFLDEYRTRLGIDGSANILATDPNVADVITKWFKDTGLVHSPEVTTPSSPILPKRWPYDESVFTHIFTTLEALDKPSLQAMKWIQYSLRWKGIVVLVIPSGSTLDSVELVDLLENASFERGKIRILDRQQTSIVLAMKWDMLCA